MEGFDGRWQGQLFTILPTPSHDVKKRLLTASHILDTYGPSASGFFDTTFFTITNKTGAIHWPQRPDFLLSDIKPTHDFKNRQFFHKVIPENNPQRETIWTNLVQVENQRWWVVTAIPIYLEDRYLGAAKHSIELHSLVGRVFDNRLAGAHNTILSQEGNVIVHPRHKGRNEQEVRKLNQQLNADEAIHGIYQEALKLSGIGTIAKNPINGDHLAIRLIEGPDWYFAVSLPNKIFEEIAYSAARTIFSLSLIGLLLELAWLWWILRREVGYPLNKLTVSAKLMTAGVSPENLELDRDDEIGELSRGFDHMYETISRKMRELTEEVKTRQIAEQQLQHRNRELKKEVAERRTVERNLSVMVNQARGTLIYIASPEGQTTLGNRFFEDFFSLEGGSWEGQNLWSLQPPSVSKSWKDSHLLVLGEQRVVQKEEVFSIDGKSHHLLSVKFPLFNTDGEFYAICGISTDITDRVDLEEQLRQSQKVEALGRLAGGVAHDFNNLLLVIMGNVELLKLSLNNPPEVRTLADEARDASHRAARLTHQLLTFSRKQTIQGKVVDIEEAVDSVKGMLKSLVGNERSFKYQTSTQEVAKVYINPIQLEQVLLNLVSNAKDATQEGGTVEVAISQNAALPASAPEALQNKSSVAIIVQDDGEGIPESIRDKIFDPFFTTKDVGKGTGLGLATVNSIVLEANGFLEVDSRPGSGTKMIVHLPLYEGEQLQTSHIQFSEHVEVPEQQKGKTILVAEDEDSVRRLICACLTSVGYKTLEAKNGREALLLLERNPQVRLLLCDVAMPVQNGPKTIRQLQRSHPELGFGLVSGYIENRADLEPTWPLLPKPFTPHQLIDFVSQLLATLDKGRAN